MASEFKRASMAAQAVSEQRLSHMESTMKNVEALLQRLEVSRSSPQSGDSSNSTGSHPQNPLMRSMKRITIASLHMVSAAYNCLFDYPKAALKDIKQNGSVADYRARFEELATKVLDIPEPWLISFFIAGLDDHLRDELVVAQPMTYFHTISLAKLYEQKFNKNSISKFFATRSSHSRSLLSSAPLALPAPPPKSATAALPFTTVASSSVTTSSVSPAYKKLIAAEIKEKRAKGLCYYCLAKYTVDHKCPAQCYLLISQDELDAL
ncbi:Ty3/gypsy retrotransposon protein [Senna tora]|uniref:Ty3/gypsy retrotransposon protein n=1 Tax=Senna tora TaxID=362788 RepID=A0A835CJN8_9FABA|nr:Ty3/gypsy retrotransposon protein [Senna tora]